MLLVLSLMNLISDYLLNANQIYADLLAYNADFKMEVAIIAQAGCQLLENDDIEDFYLDGVYVNVEKNDNSYLLTCADLKLRIETQQRMITYYSYE